MSQWKDRQQKKKTRGQHGKGRRPGEIWERVKTQAKEHTHMCVYIYIDMYIFI